MAGLNPGQYPQFDRLLDEHYRSLINQVRSTLEHSGNVQYRAVAGWVAEMGAHTAADVLADIASPSLIHEVAELRHILNARRRIQQGTYGVCEACGTAIEVAWLRVHPTAPRCQRCEKRRGPAVG